MIVIKNERTVFFDVDGTLVEQPVEPGAPIKDLVHIEDPLLPNRYMLFKVNEAMVRLLKEEHHRGAHVVVWSRGGYEWAATVVDALDIRNYVHQVMTKPLVYFDDVSVEQWLPYRVFLSSDTVYKR